MRKHCLSSPVLQSLSKLYNFLGVCNSRQKDGLGRIRLHQGQWGQHGWPELLTAKLGLTLCPGPVQHPCIALTQPQVCRTQLGWGRSTPLTLCVQLFVGDHWWCEPALTLHSRLQRSGEKRHALTDIPGIQNSWLHCVLTIVLLNVNHSVYYSYYSFTSYNRLDPALLQSFHWLYWEWDQVLSGTLAGCFHIQLWNFCFTQPGAKTQKTHP